MDASSINVSQHSSFLYLSRVDVVKASQSVDSVEVMRQVFGLHASHETLLPDEAYLGWQNQKQESLRSLNMPSYLGGDLDIAGTKIINSNPGNPQRNLPRASGVTLLFDTLTARIQCIMEAAYISSLRTASVSALSVELCQGPKEITTLAVIGAGVLAEAHIALFIQRLARLRRVLMFDFVLERMQACYENLLPLLQQYNVQMSFAESAQQAVEQAELVVPATTTTTGYIQYNWLNPGTILINVSLDDVLPEVVFRADKVIVDDWTLVKNDPRRLIGRMYRAGQIIAPDDAETIIEAGQRKIDAQIGDLVLGTRKGRERAEDIILVNPFGLSIEDIGLASHIYQRAQALGLGTHLDY
ncbi:ornithine cyclodeaminase family protein [Dictyobacter arantiisoli]|uniref:2,3-diaminopropionate biosynthesis protein SbnB n=1 Tax=Dictyobacter arantiisoli TaxID=2014874 RepID=A0A5A5T7N6_9CHLR|nr:ornithine cyclodeaminase family protein [Dictyobacter arantiisoli]GCF07275.1 2,3-diaminopropionate biosynthesis protein SbnB [Dictyobacter arantiisoli]